MEDKIIPVDVKKIMEEIRADIKAKGYDKEPILFSEICFEGNKITDTFNLLEWKTNLQKANLTVQVNYYRDLQQGNIKGFIKRAIRKFMYFLIYPIIEEQNRFNVQVVRCLNQIDKYIEENENCIIE